MIPIHRIFDEGKAREFYVDFLGFKVDWEHRSSPAFPCTCRSPRTGASCTCPGTMATAVLVRRCGLSKRPRRVPRRTGIEALRVRSTRNRTSAMDTRHMSVKDPFGNRLTFTTAL